MAKTIKTTWGEFEIHTLTGKVIKSDKNITHHDVFLQDDIGKEHALNISRFNITCREGNMLSLQWLIKKNKEYGVFVVHNHSYSQTVYDDEILKTIFGVRWGFILFFAIFGGIISFFFTENAPSGVIIGGIIGIILFQRHKNQYNRFIASLSFS